MIEILFGAGIHHIVRFSLQSNWPMPYLQFDHLGGTNVFTSANFGE
jgi:hypothetical protein